jgi:hypothetical protein
MVAAESGFGSAPMSEGAVIVRRHFGSTHAAATFTVHTHSKLCSLLTAPCSPLSIHCSLFTALFSLLSFHCSLFTALFSLLSFHCSLFTALRSLLSAHCSPLTALRSLLCSLLSVHCSLRSAHSSPLGVLAPLFYILLFLSLSSSFPCLNLSRTDQSILTVCTLRRLALAVLIVSQHPKPRSSLTPQDSESSFNTLSFDQVQPRKISIVSHHLIISPGKVSIKMSTGVLNLLQQTELDVNHISEVQILLKDKSEHLKVINSFEHNGVLLLEVQWRKTIVRCRVLVLGESLAQAGQVVLMRLSQGWGKSITTHGLELDSAGGIYGTHWCSGLAIKQVPMENKTNVSIAERELHEFREGFCKNLLEMIRNDEHWSKQKWKDIKVNLTIVALHKQTLTCHAERDQRRKPSSPSQVRRQQAFDQVSWQG